MKRLAALLLALACGAALAQGSHHTHQHRFTDAEKWAKEFDDPARDEWQKPAEVIRALALAPDARVADVGAGTGYFAVRLARAVPRGTVYAVDLEKDMVRYLGERAKKEGLANLVPVLGAPESPKIPAPANLVLVVDTYHHVDHRVEYFRRLRASLAPGGRVAIVDFNETSKIGPPPQARVPAATVKAELAKAGYALEAEHAFLPNQYFLVFRAAN